MIRILALIVVVALASGCKKKEEFRTSEETHRSEAANANPAMTQIKTGEIVRYVNPVGVSDVFVVCVEGQKVGITERGGITKLDFVHGHGIQSCP